MTTAPTPHYDRTPFLSSAGEFPVPIPYIYDLSERALQARVVAYMAKRYVDMMYVSGLSRAQADARFRPRAYGLSGGLLTDPQTALWRKRVMSAWEAGRISVVTDDDDRRATASWEDSHGTVTGQAIAREGYGGIVLGPHAAPDFEIRPIARTPQSRPEIWPLGDGALDSSGVEGPPALRAAMDTLFERSSGIYGLLVATPNRVLAERYANQGGVERVTPSWSMTKAISGTLIGRLLQEGWLDSVYDPAPAPLWRDPRAVHRQITIDHLMRMRSGLAFPAVDDAGTAQLVFENSFVYYNAEDAFTTAQRAVVAAQPGTTYRYINTGLNVLGAIIRDQIERRGLPYHETVYTLLADRIGMTSYQHSADFRGNFIASGSGAATLRDFARFGVLYLNDGLWNGERLLPEGWVDYALTPSHAGTHYAGCFRTNADGVFPNLPAGTAWASGASDQRVMLFREQGVLVAVTNETDYPLDLGALDRVGVAAMAAAAETAQAAE